MTLIKRFGFAICTAFLVLIGLLPINLIWYISLVSSPSSLTPTLFFLSIALRLVLCVAFVYYQYRIMEFIGACGAFFFGESSDIDESSATRANRIYRALDSSGSLIVDSFVCPTVPSESATIDVYTGVTDKDNNMVFESDIIRIYNGNRPACDAVIVFNKGAFLLSSPALPKNAPPMSLHDLLEQSLTFEVVGNIHQNPHFLKDLAATIKKAERHHKGEPPNGTHT